MTTRDDSFAQPPSAAWWDRRAGWVAASLGIVCYLNVLPNQFANDGGPIVKVSDKVQKPGQWKIIWTTDYWSRAEEDWRHRDLLYRPMAVSTYRLVRIVAGSEAWPQHLVNILLHGLACALLVNLGRRAGMTPAASLAAGVLFAVHPIHTEVIGNMVGRADLLATCGLLAALLTHERMVRSPSTGAAIGWGSATMIFAFIAMSSKESAVALILIVALFDLFWMHARARSEQRSWNLREHLNAASVARLMWVIVPTIAYLWLRYHALGGRLHQKPALTKTVNVLVDAPMWQHVLGVIQLWGMYWAKTFWPKTLNVIYSITDLRLATSWLDGHVLIGLGVGAALLVAAVRTARRGEWLATILIVSLLAAYFPTSNAWVLMQVFFAERIWYLPSIFVCLLLGMAFAAMPSRPSRNWIAGALVAVMVVRCWIRNPEWKDNGTLYAAAYRDAPQAVVAVFSHGMYLVSEGNYDEGIPLLQKAVEIDLGYTDAHRILGRAYLEVGRYAEAVHHLQIANLQIPGHPTTVQELELAAMLLAESAEDELAALRERAEVEGADVQAQLALIGRLREVGRLSEALERMEKADERFSTQAVWHQEYAVTLLYLNRRDEALDRYARAIQLAPEDARLLVEYAMLLLERREGDDVKQAEQLAGRAAAMAPDAPFVLVCRAELLALRGDLSKAAALYRQALATVPEGSSQHGMLMQRLRALGG